MNLSALCFWLMISDQHLENPPADAAPRAQRYDDSRDPDVIMGRLSWGAITGVIVGVVGIFAVAMGVAMVSLPIFNVLGISREAPGSTQEGATAAIFAVYAAFIGWAGIARLKWYFVSSFMLALPIPFLILAGEFVRHH